MQTIQAEFGQNIKIWLFGSRADDNKRGGDIDLYVETATLIPQSWRKKIAVVASLQIQLGDQKIDLVVHCPDEKEYPIHQIAKKTGTRL
ncbi:nucleotidyltransferase domain-containing protein [Thiotrichales bacterium HSG14]|nr:nucleotidyltransferase domain-containing protein [Thiotrichales bacterium HSG14]